MFLDSNFNNKMPLPKDDDTKESNYGYVYAVSGPGKLNTKHVTLVIVM